jgi:hypothetical protein
MQFGIAILAGSPGTVKHMNPLSANSTSIQSSGMLSNAKLKPHITSANLRFWFVANVKLYGFLDSSWLWETRCKPGIRGATIPEADSLSNAIGERHRKDARELNM